MLALDRCGWGADAGLDAPISERDAIERCRALALRTCVELLNDAAIGGAMSPLFVVPADDPRDPRAALARLLGLLRDLVDRELPRLRRMVRCESVQREAWQREPFGGRVDAAASIRTSLARRGSAAPETWLVKRADRIADTPVNNLVAAILRDTEATLRRIVALDRAASALLCRERSLVAASLAALRSFFAVSPLGDLPVDPSPTEALLLAAQRRRAELARFAGLVAFWRALQETDIASLRAVTEGCLLRDLTPAACYESACAAGLVLALRERFVPDLGGDAGTFSFQAPGGRARVVFGARPERRYARRPCTAMIELSDGGEIVIEARNAGHAAAADLAERLYLACASSSGRRGAYLLTPTSSPEPDDPAVPFRWRPFLARLDLGANPVTEWITLLSEIWPSSAKERKHAA